MERKIIINELINDYPATTEIVYDFPKFKDAAKSLVEYNNNLMIKVKKNKDINKDISFTECKPIEYIVNIFKDLIK